MGENVKRALQRLDVRPTRTRGQNFLIQPAVLDSIVAFGEAAASDDIVEIGGGLGALTEKLAALQPRSLTVIEIEPKFCVELQARFPSVHVIEGDARTIDYSRFAPGSKVFGNLPYAYSTEILFRLIEGSRSLPRATLLLQREFVDRIAAAPGGRDYGTISVMVQLVADVQRGLIVSGSSFHPPTEVESRVVSLQFLATPRYEVADRSWLRRVVKAAFHQRRKKISNSLRSLGNMEPQSILEALSECQIDPSRRAETLSVEEYVRLAASLQARVPGGPLQD